MATQNSGAFKDFIWFDRAAKVSKDEEGNISVVPHQKGFLSQLGQTMAGVGAAYSGDTQWLQRQQAQNSTQEEANTALLLKSAQANAEAQAPEKLYKELEAKAKLSAMTKMQRGQPLTDYEKQLIGYKDPTEKPSDMELWRQAYKQAVTSLGGSDMVGLSPERAAGLNRAVQSEYLGLKRQFKTETPDERLERAKMFLKQSGYSSSNETASMFLEQNKGF